MSAYYNIRNMHAHALKLCLCVCVCCIYWWFTPFEFCYHVHTHSLHLSLSRFVFLSLSTYLSTCPCVCTCVVASMPLCPYTGTLIPHRWHHREFKRHDNRWLTCIATPYQRRCVYCHGESAKHPRSIHDCCAAVHGYALSGRRPFLPSS